LPHEAIDRLHHFTFNHITFLKENKADFQLLSLTTTLICAQSIIIYKALSVHHQHIATNVKSGKCRLFCFWPAPLVFAESLETLLKNQKLLGKLRIFTEIKYFSIFESTLTEIHSNTTASIAHPNVSETNHRSAKLWTHHF